MLVRRSRFLAFLLVCFLVASCAPLSPVALPTSPPTATDVAAHLNVGDFIRVTLVGGRREEFRVTAITERGLVAPTGRTVAYADIVRIEREAYDPTATKAATGLVVVGLIVVLVAVAAALGGLAGGL